jgi:hypothetical protein
MIRKMTVVICKHLRKALEINKWRWVTFNQAMQIPSIILTNVSQKTLETDYTGPTGLKECVCIGYEARNRINRVLDTSTRMETFVEMDVDDGVHLNICFYQSGVKEYQLRIDVRVSKDASVYYLGCAFRT